MTDNKVLIVDDDASFLQMLHDYFKNHSYQVYAVNNLEDAINVFRRNKPRVVLLDFSMPIVNGDKFLPILQEINPLVKAIVISGYTNEEVEDKFRGLGYFAFFEKGGLSLESLKAKLDEALNY